MDTPPTDIPTDERKVFYYKWGSILCLGGAGLSAVALFVLMVCYQFGVFGNPDHPDVIRTAMVPMSAVAVASFLLLILGASLGAKHVQAKYVRRAGAGSALDPGTASPAAEPGPRAGLRCRKCEAPNAATAKFCNQCGSAI